MKKNWRIRGQSLVEFALMLPLFLVLIMGLFDIGRAVLYYAAINTAAREGTRFAIMQPVTDGDRNFDCENPQTLTDADICTEVRSKFFNIGDLEQSLITITYSPKYDNDTLVQIGIDLAYEPITPGLGLIGDFTLNANSQMLMTPLARPVKE